MQIVFSIITRDHKRSQVSSFLDENYPDVTSKQLMHVLNECIRKFYTREMAERGKSMSIIATEPQPPYQQLAYSFMSVSERLSMND